MRSLVDNAIDDLLREAEADLSEVWSDAARAASLAARRARARGENWRRAAAGVYAKHGGSTDVLDAMAANVHRYYKASDLALKSAQIDTGQERRARARTLLRKADKLNTRFFLKRSHHLVRTGSKHWPKTTRLYPQF